MPDKHTYSQAFKHVKNCQLSSHNKKKMKLYDSVPFQLTGQVLTFSQAGDILQNI